MSQHDVPEAYGVFKPVGHVVISFPTDADMRFAQAALAEQGDHWLVVRAPDDDEARRVAALVRPFNAERAQKYGRLIVEELIEHGDDLPQVAESPARGLDAQTVSGRERDR